MKFNRSGNVIYFNEKYHFSDLSEALAAIYQAVHVRGYSDLVLDFSGVEVVSPDFMLPLCDYVYELRQDGVGIDLKVPNNERRRRLFLNANWAYYLDPGRYLPSNFKGYTQVPATLFTNDTEQHKVVTDIVMVILSSLDGLERDDFAAFEWAINEITDNVLVHAKSNRGFVQVSHFHKKNKKISFIVCDSGDGIPKTLRAGIPSITSDSEALAQSIREGVTRDKSVGQGNGLFGSYQVCSASGGSFSIRSGFGVLDFNKGELTVKEAKVPYNGTIVVSEVDFSKPNLLAEALKFGGEQYKAWTRIEAKYEDDIDDNFVLNLNDEVQSYRSRLAGAPLRNKVRNLIKMYPDHKVFIDFSNVGTVSSSFADELVGKLALEIGKDSYEKKVRFINLNGINEDIISRAVGQRLGAIGDVGLFSFVGER